VIKGKDSSKELIKLSNLNEIDLNTYSFLVSNQLQELIIFPTEQCNFRCVYCYEDFKMKQMSPDIVNSIKKFLENRVPEIKYLTINWFGGEPLLAKKVVIDISKYAQNLSKKYNALSYSSTMTTNGYLLTPSTFNNLVEVGITEYQISLDGPKDIHNLTRIKANGSGSFETIWKNLLSIKQSNHSNVKIILRIHLTNENLPYMKDFMLELKKHFVNDSRFTVFLKPVAKLGGLNDENLDLINSSDRVSIIQQLEAILYEDSQRLETNTQPNICYAARPNSIAIRSDGSLAKCTVALQDERNSIGNINPDGTLNIIQERLAPWLRGLTTLDRLDLSCPKQKLS
ncbi:radical SAM protein, partial [Bacillus mycoides]|uniref:radical SAM protein n=1 Tax=Bacillus mycoides TaxID=1405 RepID=UPI002AA0CAD2